MFIKKVQFFISLFILFSATVSCALLKNKDENGVLLRQALIDQQNLKEREVYYVTKEIDLNGGSLIIPSDCKLVFTKGYVINGCVRFNNTSLEGKVDLRCRTTGTVRNDTVKMEWFNYSNHAIADAFALSDGKTLVFGKEKQYRINYAILIPSCTVVGNNSTIILENADENPNEISMVKIRNTHYEGEGVDSFSIKGLNFVTEIDNIFLFNMQNTENCSLKECRFCCKGAGRKCSHVVDLRGNNTNILFDNCSFINESDAKEGGGFWIRSFNDISDVRIKNSYFYNNSTDEILAFNATTKDIKNVVIENCEFDYHRGTMSPEPHVMWGMVQKAGMISNIDFINCTLKSDYLMAYIINANNANDVTVTGCRFYFDESTMNRGGLNTTAFNGSVLYENIIVEVKDVKRQEDKTSVTLFGPMATIKNATITNDCNDVYIGGPKIYDSTIDYDNSQLFNARIPSVMINCKVRLGKGTPKLAANPYDQNEECNWQGNIIESAIPVEFHLVYKKDYIHYNNNQTKNVKINGTPLKN